MVGFLCAASFSNLTMPVEKKTARTRRGRRGADSPAIRCMCHPAYEQEPGEASASAPARSVRATLAQVGSGGVPHPGQSSLYEIK